MWASEDIEAVFDQDPQRVCILQGPVAVKHAIKKDEPIGELLGGIVSSLTDKLLARQYGGDLSKVPTADFLGRPPKSVTAVPAGVQVEKVSTEATYRIGSKVPETAAWLEALAGPELTWLRAFLTSTTIIQGNTYIDNPIRLTNKSLLNARTAFPFRLLSTALLARSTLIKELFKAAEITFSPASEYISITLNEDRRGVSFPFPFL